MTHLGQSRASKKIWLIINGYIWIFKRTYAYNYKHIQVYLYAYTYTRTYTSIFICVLCAFFGLHIFMYNLQLDDVTGTYFGNSLYAFRLLWKMFNISWRQSSIKVTSSNNLINTRSRVIGALSAMLNGQKRKTGEKSAWIMLDSLLFPQCCTLSWLTWNHNGWKKACCGQNRILFQ